MKWKEAKNKEGNIYDLPGNWLKIEYFEALNILFRIENSLRIFVYIVLKNEFQDKWRDLSITSDDAETSTLGAIAKKRLSQDKNYAYLGYILNSPLLHLTSGELIRVITSDSYWKYFKNYFLGSKEIIKNKLDEIGNVRNSLAHFRPIKKGDIDLVKQNSIHTLSEIENTIKDFINCQYIVPTNTDEKWYNEIITLGTEECKINFMQSKKEDWIKLTLSFDAPIIQNVKYYYGYQTTTLNLKTDRILLDYPNLAKFTICITEINPSFYIKNPEEFKLVKQLKFSFSRKSLDNNYSIIKTELEKILLQISKEIALIKDDNLARGKLIEVVKCIISKKDEETFYKFSNDIFQIDYDENSPVEFWGMLNNSSSDFITNTEKYPWIPVDISEDKDIPF
ncbi:MAG: hypothetical protein KKA19_01420 [Candidatus Margulisbacteria bacterium]|nr:hypothetical protein [Candidatus Margulisiibacteriota bacterium]